jgi:alkanesulfonate monooxygenase SsuD/methylene tetrahydromethanopterin reductase-like flavin-dependent oxidoreductase (luciferase family)
MQVGMSLTSSYAVSDPRAGARYMVERARASEAAQLDSLFVGDHHATPIPYYQNTPILARMLAEWGERPAGALYLLPLWHPVLLAEQIGTLAAIARGRFILQCAVGRADEQFEAMGVNARHRPSRFEQSLDIMRRLWAGEAVEHSGRWQLKVSRIRPVPAEPVEVWIGATARAAIDRAARIGDGWLASPHLPPPDAARQLAYYAERCAAHGRPTGVAAIRRDVYVGESADEAEQTGGAVLRSGYRGFPPGATVVGDIEGVSKAFAELAELGFQHAVVRNLVADQSKALASIERLGEVRQRVARL